MQASTITKALAAAATTGIAASQTLVAAGALVLNGSLVSGGIAILDTSQRRVIVSSAGNDSGLIWTVIGTANGGQTIVDKFAGANVGDAQSNLDFLTVTSISGSGASAATVSAGTNGVGSSPWKLFDSYIGTPNLGFDYELLSGSASVNIEYTQEPFLQPISTTGSNPAPSLAPANPNPTAQIVPGMGALAASAQGSLNFPIHGWRLTILSGTGSTRLTGRQAGLMGG